MYSQLYHDSCSISGNLIRTGLSHPHGIPLLPTPRKKWRFLRHVSGSLNTSGYKIRSFCHTCISIPVDRRSAGICHTFISPSVSTESINKYTIVVWLKTSFNIKEIARKCNCELHETIRIATGLSQTSCVWLHALQVSSFKRHIKH